MMKLKVLTDPETGVKTLDPNDPATGMAMAMLGGRGSISDLLNAKEEDGPQPGPTPTPVGDGEDMFLRETALKVAAEAHYSLSHKDIVIAAQAYYEFLTGTHCKKATPEA